MTFFTLYKTYRVLPKMYDPNSVIFSVPAPINVPEIWLKVGVKRPVEKKWTLRFFHQVVYFFIHLYEKKNRVLP